MKLEYKEVTDKYGIAYFVWANAPKEIQLTEENTSGEKPVYLWLAGTPRSQYATLIKWFPSGEPMYPDGGVQVLFKREIRYFDLDEVVIHPRSEKINKPIKIRRKRKPKEPCQKLESKTLKNSSTKRKRGLKSLPRAKTPTRGRPKKK